MYQVPEAPPAIPKGFWHAVGTTTILGAGAAALVSWRLNGSPTAALMGALIGLPICAIQLYTILKRRQLLPTEAQLRRARLDYAGSVVLTVVAIMVWALLDSAPGLQINVHTSRWIGILLTLLYPRLVGQWLVQRDQHRRLRALQPQR